MNRHERRAQNKRDNKAQHFIAKSYARAWCDPNRSEREEPYVWLFDRDGPTDQKPGKRKAPANIFSEPEMYTIRSVTDPTERDLTLEKELGRIESEFCNVRREFIEPRKPLGPRERQIVCGFAAAQQHRTPRARDHVRSQWSQPLKMMREMSEQMKLKTPQERREISQMFNYGPPSESALTMDQVEAIVDQPLQTMMAPTVNSLAPMLGKLNFSIFCTETKPGFITSDEPCVWFDPESYKRPPLYQSPALMYRTLEITLPLSPRSLLMLSYQPFPEYFDVDKHDLLEMAVTDINRRTCRYSRNLIVVSTNEFRPDWANDGELPLDGWKPKERVRPEGAK